MTTPETERRSVPGYPDIHATNEGDIISTRRGFPVQLRTRLSRAIVRVMVTDAEGIRRSTPVHRLVLLAFAGPRPSARHVARHLDGDPANNRLSNIAWGTRSENNAEAVRRGTHSGLRRGERHNAATLTDHQVIEIADRLRAGHTFENIAQDYGVVPSTIGTIKSGQCWKHVTTPILFPWDIQSEAA